MVKGERKGLTEISRELTFNVHKYTHRIQFKKKAPRCIREIRKLVTKMFRTKDVRIDTKLNNMVWSNGIQRLPRKLRIRVSRKENKDAEKGDKFYSLVEGLIALRKTNRDQFSGKLTENVRSS